MGVIPTNRISREKVRGGTPYGDPQTEEKKPKEQTQRKIVICLISKKQSRDHTCSPRETD